MRRRNAGGTSQFPGLLLNSTESTRASASASDASSFPFPLVRSALIVAEHTMLSIGMSSSARRLKLEDAQEHVSAAVRTVVVIAISVAGAATAE